LLHEWRIGKVRGAVALVIGALLGASVLAPTLGLAANFLTKKKADKRYLRKTEVFVAGSTHDTALVLSSSTFQSLASVNVAAPRNGYLYIVGSASAQGAGIRDALRFRVNQRFVTSEPNAFKDSTGGTGNDEYTAGLTAVVKVAKGNHAVHLEGSHLAGPPSNLTGRSLSVLFVPQGSAPTIPV
jgi:hypothetical protein